MAKKGAESGVYRVTEIIGTSSTSWEELQEQPSKPPPRRCAICVSRKLTSLM